MTTAHRTIPLAWSDSLIRTVYQLEAYHALSQAYLEKVIRDTSYSKSDAVLCGTDDLFQPVLDDLKAFLGQMDQMRQVYDEIDSEASGGVSNAQSL